MINKINFSNVAANRFSKKTNNEKQNTQVEGKNSQYFGHSTSPKISANYFVPFLGKKDYTANEKEYAALKKQLSKKFHKLNKNAEETCWDFYINSTDENEKKYSDAFSKSLKLSSDEKILENLQKAEAAGVADPLLKKSLDKLLKDYKETVVNAAAIQLMEDKQTEISKKFNGCRGEVEGKVYSNSQLNKMLETEKNVELRKEIYSARKVKAPDLIADDLVNLVKTRNEYAKKNGYDNYFSYMLKETYKVDEKKLFSLLDDLADKTDKIYDKTSKKRDEKLADAYGIATKDLRPWHYGLQMEGSPTKEADKYLKDSDTMVKSATEMYKKMGWDIPKMPILLDLFPKENKNQHGFCFSVDTNKDVRILANLTNNMDSLETLNHELGHAVYDIGISGHLSYFDREPASSAMTEAVAMLMQTLPQREGMFEETLNMPKELSNKLDNSRRKGSVNFVRQSLVLINFEKELYKNPDQDLPKLWSGLEKKYLNKNMQEKPDNSWASIPHFLTHPAYYQNYLRAEIIASQVYDAAREKLGPLNQSGDTADFMRKKIFRHGASLTEDEVIKNATGKDLSVDAFCNQFKDLKVD